MVHILLWFIIAGLLFLHVMQSLFGAARYTWDKNCQEKLIELVATENKYQIQNSKFSSFDDLVKDGYINNLSADNYIDNYKIVYFKASEKELKSGNDIPFIIIALPRSEKNKLRTFSINQNSELKIWNGNKIEWNDLSNEFDNTKLWKLIHK